MRFVTTGEGWGEGKLEKGGQKIDFHLRFIRDIMNAMMTIVTTTLA